MRIEGRWAVLAALGVLLTACTTTPKVPPPSTDIDETALREHIRVLASDDFEGRRPGTPGEEKTIAYVVDQFRELGLKPGNGESFLQQVPMQETSAGADATLSFTGHGTGPPISLPYGKNMVIWTARGQPLAELRQSEMVFVGFGIVAPEYQWNDYADTDVRGKTVLVLVNDPGYATKDPKMFKGGAMTYYGRWSYKIEEAARHGAAGVLLVHDADALGYGWEVVRNTCAGPQLDLAGSDAVRPAVEGWVQKDAARTLFAAAGLDFTALSAAAARAGFKASGMGLRVDATLHNSVRQFSSPNVVAIWPGGKRRREYVVYTAHWDHLGRDPQRPGHNIFNGALDNASGVAGLITVAQSFVRTKPVADRTIAFLALTGGDFGLLGSRYYVENPVLPLRDTAAVLNLDTLHGGGPTRDVTIFGSGNSDLEEYARASALLQGREVTPEPMLEQGLYFRSDNFTFARAGVPALYAKGGLDDAARGPAWGRAQLDDYMTHRYHQPGDQYSPNWDVRGAVEDLGLYYDVGNRVAHTRRFPRWYPNSEYSASRDRAAEP
jgi:Zn-dependent M28 family amino/carboxypeptidase